jgi:long-subunit fatty acid transport protein
VVMAVVLAAAVVAIAQVAVAVQVVVAAVTAVKPQRSSINTAVLLREQQGVN